MGNNASTPSLMKYGLHNELPSDTDDSDYKQSSGDNLTMSEDDEVTSEGLDSKAKDKLKTEKQSTSKSLTKKTKKNRKNHSKATVKIRPFADDVRYYNSADESDDDDYIPVGVSDDIQQPSKAKKRKRKSEAKRNKGASKKPKKDTGDDMESNAERSSEHWCTLPVEILSRIFRLVATSHEKGAQFLFRCSCVCRHWCRVAQMPVSLEHMDLSFAGPRLGKEEADQVLLKLSENLLREVRSLNLSGWSTLTNAGLMGVAENCFQLERLNISNCQQKMVAKLSADSLIPLAENCLNLTHVIASNLRIASNYNKTLNEFIDIRGINFVHVNFSNNIAFSSASLNAIMRNCSQLEYLDCSNTSIRGIYLKQLQCNCPLLKELYLANVGLEVKDKQEDLSNSPGFKHLVLVSFASPRSNSWMTDQILHSLLKNANKLKTLDLRGCYRVQLIDAQVSSDVIERLYISECQLPPCLIDALRNRWADTLWDLDMSKNNFLADTHFFTDLSVGQSAHSKLLHLNLSGTDIQNQNVIEILDVYDNLESFNLTSCRSLSRGLKRLHCGKKDIKKLRKSCEALEASD